jgi:hypothetical protein
VRLAEFLLDGIRQGQPLAVLLGYRFERGLHERSLDQFIAVFRRIAPFGELLKAQVALEQADAEVERLRLLGHPDLPAAEAALTAARTRHQQLLAEQAALPARVAAADADVQRFSTQLTQINADIQRVGNLIQRALSAHPPRPTAQLEAQLDTLVARKASVTQSRQQAVTRAADARARINTIPNDIASALRDVQQAERIANDLRTRPHPGLAPAQQAAADARALYQSLLDAHRQKFLFPNDATQGAMESVAAVQVVDGLALLQLYQAGSIPFGRNGAPVPGSPEHAGVVAELDALADAVDAVRDALTGESVFHLVQGRPARAGATLDAIAGGEMPPPELELMRTPRRGAVVTHRVLALLPVTGATPGWPVSPRARAEPALNAWAGQLLGDRARVRFQLLYIDPATDRTLLTRKLRLSDVPFLAPIDLLQLTQVSRAGRYPDVERMLMHLLDRKRPARVPASAVIRIVSTRIPGAAPEQRSLAELLDLAHVAGRLVTEARPLRDADLTRPDTTAGSTVDTTELRARVKTAEKALLQISQKLDQALNTNATPDAVATILASIALFGLPEAIPVPAVEGGVVSEDLLARAAAVQKQVARRLAEAQSSDAQFVRTGATAEALRDHELARMETIFGSVFRALPRLRPANAAELDEAFAASLSLQGGDPFAAATWLGRMARVRRPVDRLNTVLTLAEALDGTAPALSVGQLPVHAGAQWCALPPPAGSVSPDGALSLIAYVPQPVATASPVTGFQVDEWVEVIPERQMTTGIAFNFDEPASQAPQVILLAVPPDDSPTWDISDLEAITREALELAHVRAVDPETLAAHTDLDQLLPALCFSLNLQNHTISTDFRRIAESPA